MTYMPTNMGIRAYIYIYIYANLNIRNHIYKKKKINS